MALRTTSVILVLLASYGVVIAETENEKTAESASADLTDEQQKLFDEFGNLFLKSVMFGTFTVDGADEMKPQPERYEISKAVKQDKGDYWVFFTRIQYGKHDVTFPVPVEVKWAGTTPVITVDNLEIPAMGVFDARVVISDNKYAGTWRHGKVGGLMFGHIEKQRQAPAGKPKSDSGVSGGQID